MADRKLKIGVELDGKSVTQLKAEAKTIRKAFEDAPAGSPAQAQAAANFQVINGRIKEMNAALGTSNFQYFKLGEQIRYFQVQAAKAVAIFYTLKKAFDLAEAAAMFHQNMQTFASYAQKFGVDAKQAFDSVNNAASGLVDDEAVVQISNRAMSLGVPIEKLAKLMEIARAKARDMGITTEDAFESIVIGVGREAPRILYQVGLHVKLTEALKDYAKSLNKTVPELTEVEHSQAFLNATIAAGSEALSRHNLQIKTQVEELQAMAVAIQDTRLMVGNVLLRLEAFAVGVGYSIASAFAKMFTSIVAPFALLEALQNKLGISADKRLQELVEGGIRRAAEYDKQVDQQMKLAFASEAELNKAMAALAKTGGEADDEAKAAKGSLKDLEAQAKKLKDEMDLMSDSTADYWEKARQLRKIELRIEGLKEAQKLFDAAKDSTARLDAEIKKLSERMAKLNPESDLYNKLLVQRIALEERLALIEARKELLKRSKKPQPVPGSEKTPVSYGPGGTPVPVEEQPPPVEPKIEFDTADRSWMIFRNSIEAGLMSISQTIGQTVGNAFAKLFGGAHTLLGQFVAAFGAALASMAAQAAAAGLLNFLFPGFGSLFPFAAGGVIPEPVVGVGMKSGRRYSFAENSPEYVTPMASQQVAFGSLANRVDSLSEAVSTGTWRIRGTDIVYVYDRNRRLLGGRRL
jgi:hypothetical protein